MDTLRPVMRAPGPPVRVVLFFGGRDYSDVDTIRLLVGHVRAQYGPFCLLHGDARGADKLSGIVGGETGLPVMAVPANWTVFGKAAGHMRNAWMLTYGRPNLAVEFPGGRGTADMRARLSAAGVPVIRAVDFATVAPVN